MRSRLCHPYSAATGTVSRMFIWVFAATMAISSPPPAAGPMVEPLAQVATLPPALRDRLQAEVLAQSHSPMQRLTRLVHFVLDGPGLGMTYSEDATTSIEQAYATRKANCVTFTLLFLALAREAGLHAYPQEIREILSLREGGGILYRSNHVNVGVHIGRQVIVVDLAGDSVIARQPPEQVSDRRLLSHYYNNLAMEHMVDGGLAQAQVEMATSLALDPGYAPHWSNAGVLYLRTGDSVAAEHAYDHALTLDPHDMSALFNMVGLLQRNGDRQRELEFHRRLEREQRRDPFHHFIAALEFERVGDYPSAIAHFRRAIALHRGDTTSIGHWRAPTCCQAIPATRSGHWAAPVTVAKDVIARNTKTRLRA